MKKQLLLIISLISFGTVAFGSAALVGHKTAAQAAGADIKQTAENAARADAKRELLKAIRPDNDQKLVIPEVLTIEDLQFVAEVVRTTLTTILTVDATSKDCKTYRAMSAQISTAIQARRMRKVTFAVNTHMNMNNEICRAIAEIFERQAKGIFLVVPTIPRSVKAADLSNDLLQATYHEAEQAVQKLAQDKALVNKQNAHFGMTPLMIACYLKNPALIKLLLEAGADMSLKDYQGNCATHYLFMDMCNAQGTLNVADEQCYLAALCCDTQMIAFINAQNNHGFTPLMIAGLSPFHAMAVRKLIEYGADNSITDKWGNKALDLAQHAENSFAYKGWYDKRSIEKQFKNVPQTRKQIIGFLADAKQILQRSNEEIAVLYTGLQLIVPSATMPTQAVDSPAVKSIDLYFKRLKNVNKQIIDFFINGAKAFRENAEKIDEPINELSIALFRNDEEAIVNLIKNKELVNKADQKHKQTPLMIACFLKRADHVKRLLAAGANPSCVDIAGNTAMHYLLMDQTHHMGGIKNVGEENYCTIIRALHEKDQNLINAQNHMGYSPCMMAAISSIHSLPLRELTRLGAHTGLTEVFGNTALDLANVVKNSSEYNDWYRGIASVMNTAAIRKHNADHLTQASQSRTATAAQSPTQAPAADHEKRAAEIKQSEADALEAALAKKARTKAHRDKQKKKAAHKPTPMKVQPKGKQKPNPTQDTAATASAAGVNLNPTPIAPQLKHDAKKSAFSAPTAATAVASASKKADAKHDAEKQKKEKEKTTQAAPTIANQLEEQLALHESYKEEFDDLMKNGTKEQIEELRGKYATLVRKLQALKCPRTDFQPIYYKYYVPLGNKLKNLK